MILNKRKKELVVEISNKMNFFDKTLINYRIKRILNDYPVKKVIISVIK